mgnify:CR=1 FL=1
MKIAVKADLCQEKLVYKDIVQKMKKGMELAEQGNSLANGQIKGKEEWQEKIDEEITRLCSAYGILKEKRLYMTGISANGYSVVICDERLMALPQWLCRGISV